MSAVAKRLFVGAQTLLSAATSERLRGPIGSVLSAKPAALRDCGQECPRSEPLNLYDDIRWIPDRPVFR